MATLISFPDVVTHDGHRLDVEAELRAVRAQAAVVRSLLDELDLLAASDDPSRLGGVVAAQTVEELTQLAWRILQTATAIAPHRVMLMAPDQTSANLSDEPDRIAG